MKNFSFSNLSLEDLESIVKLENSFQLEKFSNWFQSYQKSDISKSDLEFLQGIYSKYGEDSYGSLLQDYSEETLKAKFIIPILNRVDFFLPKYQISDFYDEKLEYSTDSFSLSGFCDFYVAKGLERPKYPYFFIQEFKKNTSYHNVKAQLLSEMVAGLEISQMEEIKGAYIIGSIWNFVILWKERDIYRYVISPNFDSTKFGDLKQIFLNLLSIKREIINLVKEKEDEKI
ncbi:MAG TPA: hypothetical protein EYO61_03930 [Campylobacterales bacterium]|nr:hypothetical protein [Campylobacterales bacterium]